MAEPRSSRGRFRAFRASGAKSKRDVDRRRRPDADRDTRRRYLRQYALWLRPQIRGLTFIFFLAVLGAILTVAKPVIIQRLIDRAVTPDGEVTAVHRFAQLHLFGLALLVVSLATMGIDTVRQYATHIVNFKLTHRLRQKLFGHILQLPLARISELKTGGIISRLSGDVDSSIGLVQTALLSPAVAAMQAAMALGIIFYWNWQLALAAIAIVPPLMLLHLLWVRRIRPIYRSMREDRAMIDGRVTETFGGVRVVRGFRREAAESLTYAVGHHTAIRKRIYARILQMIVGAGWGLLPASIGLVVMWYGGYMVIRDSLATDVANPMTIGKLFAFQWYILLLVSPVMSIINSMSQTQQSLAAVERVFDTFDEQMDKPDAPDAIEAPEHIDEIRLDHVHFEYQPGVPVLTDIDLTIPGGSMVALVGPSGAGKTTLTDLLSRFYDPTQGAILLNGIDLRKLQLQSFRQLLGIVQQDVFLFDGSVYENIAYGRRGASHDEVVAAAQRANADVFINELPDGYDSLIGERGVKLSGGQRQRISIARAILADPKLLILDEATSNLDTESEQLIQAALDDLYENRTTVVIAHRLSTVTHADVIVVLEHGRVLDAGTHDELMSRPGLYRDMVDRQRSSFDSLSSTLE